MIADDGIGRWQTAAAAAAAAARPGIVNNVIAFAAGVPWKNFRRAHHISRMLKMCDIEIFVLCVTLRFL